MYLNTSSQLPDERVELSIISRGVMEFIVYTCIYTHKKGREAENQKVNVVGSQGPPSCRNHNLTPWLG